MSTLNLEAETYARTPDRYRSNGPQSIPSMDSTNGVIALWEQARRVDRTLKLSPRDLPALCRRRVRPVPFSRQALFTAMTNGEPVIFTDLPVPVRGEDDVGVRKAVLKALASGFPPNRSIRIRSGPSEAQKYVTIDELLRRWRGGRARVNVTDLHIRGTGLMRSIACSQLSDFNLLAEGRGSVNEQEMLTMVVSSTGAYTDSHTDDPDGSNHCFVGKKLWLAWDTFAGLRHGLEDPERFDTTRKQGTFSLSGFLAVPGSRWFTVDSGQTLFLPGHFTHKVVTLRDYLGVGSFFVMLPNYLRTLTRWTKHTPLWALQKPAAYRLDLVNRITERVIGKVNELKSDTPVERARWGLDYMQSAVRTWHKTASRQSRALLLDNPISAELIRTVLASYRKEQNW